MGDRGMMTFFQAAVRARQRGRGMLKGILILIAIPLLVVGFYEGRKAYWDGQVRELCAKDGGIKVYETVKLPPEKFNQWGQPNFYKPTQGENALGADYLYKSENQYLHHGDPYLRVDRERIYRKADMKLLGEATAYVRGGGDIPGPWQPSAYRCPSATSSDGGMLMNKVFAN
jgi:hypothetical protein